MEYKLETLKLKKHTSILDIHIKGGDDTEYKSIGISSNRVLKK